ncbi:histidine phosphatase family protein [Sulfitobacter sp. S190]|uniref:histidine phosphatase family protein n=1 Tax=Sulfitobacter sp. S190 TaxID=2867022 RepID=UPI0021A28E9F|nr:histidine phosphatase family protein [Sulfitobacter sp. S190]UWR22094.1 histidine phosphatase family protein [Sulfitobacter sp. S190]
MTVWHWVRHGPTHEKTFVGWRDVPADLTDCAQIARLTDHLPDNAKLVSSDLIRASATADALTGPGHHRLAHEPDLREINFGVWDGMPFDAVAARDPQLSRAFWETPGSPRAPEGESWNETAARVDAAVDRLSHLHPDQHIIAVAHFGVILTQVQRAMRVSAYAAMAHKIDNLSVTTIQTQPDWHIHQINHLP